MKATKELNCIGYPHDDPYGLAAAFKKAFGFNNKKEKEKEKEKSKKISTKVKKQSVKDFY